MSNPQLPDGTYRFKMIFLRKNRLKRADHMNYIRTPKEEYWRFMAIMALEEIVFLHEYSYATDTSAERSVKLAELVDTFSRGVYAKGGLDLNEQLSNCITDSEAWQTIYRSKYNG